MANLAKIIDDIVTSAKLEKFFSSLKHADLPAGWQNDQGIVDAAGKLYREMGTDSPFFKAYMQGNKLTDKSGKPLIVSHTTTGNPSGEMPFTEFDIDSSGLYTRPNLRTALSDDEAVYGGDLPYLFDLFVKSENPIDAIGKRGIKTRVNKAVNMSYDKDQIRGYREELGMPYWKPEYSFDAGSTYRDTGRYNQDKVISNLKNEFNADSILFNDLPDESLVVFNPTQLKSTANRGTFDPNDPNILRTAAPWLAGGGLAAGSMLGANEAQATPRLSPDLAAWAKSAEKSQALQEPVWSPSDLFVAPIGAAGVPAKAAAMALDAPVSMALNEVLDYINSGATAVADWWRK